MGIPRARFVVDTHVHSQRHVVKSKEKGSKVDFKTLSKDAFQRYAFNGDI
jgi:hypothetical protein